MKNYKQRRYINTSIIIMKIITLIKLNCVFKLIVVQQAQFLYFLNANSNPEM